MKKPEDDGQPPLVSTSAVLISALIVSACIGLAGLTMLLNWIARG